MLKRAKRILWKKLDKPELYADFKSISAKKVATKFAQRSYLKSEEKEHFPTCTVLFWKPGCMVGLCPLAREKQIYIEVIFERTWLDFNSL